MGYANAMHRRTTTAACCCALFLLASFSIAVAASGTGTDAASFLSIPVGAAPASLGSAYSSRATDAYAPVWNPAGLGFLDYSRVSATHLSYLQGVNYEYFGLAVPIGEAELDPKKPVPPRPGVGFAVQYLGSGDIAGYDVTGNPTGNFSATFGAYSLSFAEPVTDDWSLGATAKYINETIANTSGNAAALDVGTLYRATNDLTLAGVLANAGSSVKFVNQSDPLPFNARFGATYRVGPRLSLSAEAVYREDQSVGMRGGLEWVEQKVFVIRAGADSSHTDGLSATSAVTFGAGVRLAGQEFSYAYVPYGDLGGTNYFSIDLRFGGPRQEGRRSKRFQEEGQHRFHEFKEEEDQEKLRDLYEVQ